MNKNQLFVQKVAKNLGLNLVSTQKRGEYTFRYQVAILQDEKEKKFILKLLTSENLHDKKSFFVEEQFLELADTSKLKVFVPRLIKAQITKPPFWYLREFFPHQEAGDIVVDFGLTKEFLGNVKSKVFAEFIEALWFFGEEESSQRDLPIVRSEEMPEYIVRSFEYNQKFLGKKMVDKVKKVSEQFAQTMRCSLFVFAHNDLYPGNILFKKDELKIIDFERCGYHYPLTDAVFVELLAWKKPLWQSEFKTAILEKFYNFGEKTVGNRLEDISGVYWGMMTLFWASRLLSHGFSMARKYERSQDVDGRGKALGFVEYLRERVVLSLTKL